MEALHIHIQEYVKLKDEQISRIRFRDNLVLLSLGAFGALISFAMASPQNLFSLLTLPLICFVLGWTYLINDQKVTEIGRYLREDLSSQINKNLPQDGRVQVSLLDWEYAHRPAASHSARKGIQLLVDQTTFVVPGLVGVSLYAYKTPLHVEATVLIATIAFLICGAISYMFIRNALHSLR